MIDKKMAWVIVFVVFLLSAVSSYSFFKGGSVATILSPLSNYKPPSPNGVSISPDEPKTEQCPINGEMLSKSQRTNWEKRRPLAIVVENHKESRPQSGLTAADVVYEAVAEGGITRFLAIFYCKDASPVGPVRSARIYFINLLEAYGANPLYAHVGGANTPGPADALGYIKEIGWSNYNDLNQFSVPFPYFWRDYERLPGVATEHTVYTSTSKLWQYAKDKRDLTDKDEDGVRWDEDFTPWKFEDDAKVEDRGTVAKIDFGFWDSFASDFNVVWTYDKTSNSYKRASGGAPHMDKNNGKQITSKNIVVIFAKESPANDGYEGGQHLLYRTVGSGDALIFNNGNVIKGEWSRTDTTDNLKLTDEKGVEASLVGGQVFVEMLPTGNKVNY